LCESILIIDNDWEGLLNTFLHGHILKLKATKFNRYTRS